METIEAYFKSIAKTALLSEEEELQLVMRIRAGDDAAIKLLVEANLRLVVWIAKGICGSACKHLDVMISDGNTGLLLAAERYDPSYGKRFASFARPCIRGRILNGIRSRERFNARVVSLSAPVSEDQTLEDVLSSDAPEEPHREFDLPAVSATARRLIAGLTPKQKLVVRKRYGLDGSRPMILERIGEQIGLTRQRVHQIHNAALKKMRRWSTNCPLSSGYRPSPSAP